jgi:ribosomal protein L37E
MVEKHIVHAELARVGDSKYKVVCPDCGNGDMTMRRDFHNMILLDWDTCSSCGQKFIFDDISNLRRAEWEERRRLKKT